MVMNKPGTCFLTFLLAALAPLPTVAAEDAKTEIEKLLTTYQERLSNNDIDGILALYSTNPVFIPEYAPPAVGRDSVRKAYEWVFATLKLRGQFASMTSESSGALPGSAPLRQGTSASWRLEQRRCRKQRVIRAQARGWSVEDASLHLHVVCSARAEVAQSNPIGLREC
jgi:ketosteroid isomerase-like protein